MSTSRVLNKTVLKGFWEIDGISSLIAKRFQAFD